MNNFKVVTETVAELIELAKGFLVKEAAGLVNRAESLSLDEISRGLDGLIRVLKDEEVTAPKMTIAQMEEVLRAADCLYDNTELWKQLGATSVPKKPDTVIQEAYKTGGRLILRCSSISEKADALKEANHIVSFWKDAKQEHYQQSVSKPEWIVVPSHIDQSTLGSPKNKVVTSDMPAPTAEDWFSVIAYARLDGGRQPRGCENLCAFMAETGTVVGSRVGKIDVLKIDVMRLGFHHFQCDSAFGAARLGPPRN